MKIVVDKKSPKNEEMVLDPVMFVARFRGKLQSVSAECSTPGTSSKAPKLLIIKGFGAFCF